MSKKKADTIKVAKAQLADSGIPPHICSVRGVPKMVAVSVLLGANVETITLRSGASQEQVALTVEKLADKWRAHKNGQVDIEQAIAASKTAAQ